MFADDGDHKPISIIITTLAGHSYNEEPTISATLMSILTNMNKHIEYQDDEAWIANPVNPEENFADKWAEEPKKRENFDNWLKQARHDFGLYLRASPFDTVPAVLKNGLGADLVDRTLKGIVPTTASALAAAAIVTAASSADSVHRAEAAIEQTRQVGTQSKPWVRS